MVGKVLVVDDEDTLRLTIRTRLSAAGFDVSTAVDGQEALDKLKENRYDIVLLDINMPRMDGIAALSVITERHPETDVIMLTGFADFTTAIECLKKGAKDYLVKPIDTTELITRLRGLLRARISEASLERLKKEHASVFFDGVLGPVSRLHSELEQLEKEKFTKSAKDQPAVVSHLLRLSEDVLREVKAALDTSALREGIRLFPRDVALEKIVGEIFERAKLKAKVRGVEMEKKIGSKVPKIKCDEKRIEQALDSVLQVALHTASKGATVTLQLMKRENATGIAGKDDVVVEVGVSKAGDSAQKIAESLERPVESLGKELKNSTDHHILLHVAKRLIQAHGGTLYCEPIKGGGLTFVCLLPMKGSN